MPYIARFMIKCSICWLLYNLPIAILYVYIGCALPASTQQRAINSPPAIRHSMAYRWRAVGGPTMCASWEAIRLIFNGLDWCQC